VGSEPVLGRVAPNTAPSPLSSPELGEEKWERDWIPAQWPE